MATAMSGTNAKAREMMRSVTASRLVRTALLIVAVLAVLCLLLILFFGTGSLSGGVSR